MQSNTYQVYSLWGVSDLSSYSLPFSSDFWWDCGDGICLDFAYYDGSGVVVFTDGDVYPFNIFYDGVRLDRSGYVYYDFGSFYVVCVFSAVVVVPKSSGSSGSSGSVSFNIDGLVGDLNGSFGAKFKTGDIVNVVNYSGDYVVLGSFPILNADNVLTIFYLLKSPDDRYIYVPQVFVNAKG